MYQCLIILFFMIGYCWRFAWSCHSSYWPSDHDPDNQSKLIPDEIRDTTHHIADSKVQITERTETWRPVIVVVHKSSNAENSRLCSLKCSIVALPLNVPCIHSSCSIAVSDVIIMHVELIPLFLPVYNSCRLQKQFYRSQICTSYFIRVSRRVR